MRKKTYYCLFLQDGRGQPQLSPPPLNYVNKQETESLTESVAPHLACGLTFIHCFAAERVFLSVAVEPDGGRVLCDVLLMEDVDSETIAIRIKPGRIGRTKTCIVGRNSTSAFEEKPRCL